jgi:hypothetical protein
MLTCTEFKIFRKEAEQALQGLAQKYNANIMAGNIKYDTNHFTISITVRKNDIAGKSYEQAEFEKCCVIFGLKPSDFGKTFASQGREFTICGIDMKARSMPILATSNGKTYKFKEESITKFFN